MSQSSEEDNFSAGNNEELQFDQNAFNIFGSCILFIIILFRLYKFTKELLGAKKLKSESKPKCGCQDCQQKYKDFLATLS